MAYHKKRDTKAWSSGGFGDERISSSKSGKQGLTSPSALSSDTDVENGGAPLTTRMSSMRLKGSPVPKSQNFFGPSSSRPGASQSFADVLRDATTRETEDCQLSKMNPATDEADIFSGPVESYDRPADHGIKFGVRPPMHLRHGSIPDSPVGYRHRGTGNATRHQVGGVDAQEFYPASSCVFVANLPEAVDDQALEAEVTRHFSKFGVVFVKIRRDPRNMPFAFCQFTNDRDAREGMNLGRGAVIHGRACRTEMVKANRTFVMYNHCGGDLTEEDADELLSPFGPILKIETLNQSVADAMGIRGRAVMAEFTAFDPKRDVQAAFKHHAFFRVVAHDEKRVGRHNIRRNHDEDFLTRYEIDRRSVFVGGLPTHRDTSELKDRLWQLGDTVGDVHNVQVIQKDGPRNSANVFAFVEFTRPDMAELACERMTGERVYGASIRVERKNSKEVGNCHVRRVPRNDHYLSPEHYNQRRIEMTKRSPNTPAEAKKCPASAESANREVPAHPTPLHGGNGSAMAPPQYGWMPGYNGTPFTSPQYSVVPGPMETPGYAAAAATPQLPYPMLPPQAYSWATPYLHDPNLAPVAYWHLMTQAQQAQAAASGGTPQDEATDAQERADTSEAA